MLTYYSLLFCTTPINPDTSKIFDHAQFYRIFVCNITFASMGELIFGLLALCPLMRRFEREVRRNHCGDWFWLHNMHFLNSSYQTSCPCLLFINQMGSRRFGAYIVYVSILSTIVELIIFNIFFDVERYSGPYPQLGAVLSLYHRFTPRLYPKFFGLLGYDFSEKSLVYALCAQVIFSGGWSTFVPAAVGFVSGMMCVKASENELPEFVYSMCKYSCAAIVDEGEKRS